MPSSANAQAKYSVQVKRVDQAGANALLAGDYTKRSATLMRALTKWKSELQAVSEPA